MINADTHIGDAVAFTDSCHGDISVVGRLEEEKQTNKQTLNAKTEFIRRISSSLIRILMHLHRIRNDDDLRGFAALS